jgi:hypothetical protein
VLKVYLLVSRLLGTAPECKSARAYSFTLRELWLALRLGVWLCWLPIALRRVPLPELLKRFTRVQRPPNTKTPWDVDRAVTIVSRLCAMPLFGLPIFPKPCLRQSLALYRVLTHMGYPVEIHFGVRKQGKELAGHSWVTLQGHPVAERSSLEHFKPVYSHSSGCPGSTHLEDQ